MNSFVTLLGPHQNIRKRVPMHNTCIERAFSMENICSSSDSIKSVIQECELQLGYSSVKPEEEEAVKAFVKQRRDVFIAVPTGF